MCYCWLQSGIRWLLLFIVITASDISRATHHETCVFVVSSCNLDQSSPFTKHFRYPMWPKHQRQTFLCSVDSIKLLLYYLIALFYFNWVFVFFFQWTDVWTVMSNPHYVCGGGRHEEKTAIKHRGVYSIPLIKTTKTERVSLVMVSWSRSVERRRVRVVRNPRVQMIKQRRLVAKYPTTTQKQGRITYWLKYILYFKKKTIYI